MTDLAVSALSVSIVIVSRGRAAALSRCLLGISQLQFSPFEVVVVADPEGARAAGRSPFAADLKILPFDAANISAARNLGVTHAAGEVIAFIDDDAVPEPLWLRHLVAPFSRAGVAATGGFVRGRNGISFQWKARRLDALGEAHALSVDPHLATVLHPPKGQAIKTEGTNMAFRRTVLIDLGGFDPAFHYYLDETDLNMRLARAGHATAIVPLAEVHHGFGPNPLRNSQRVPRDLFDIGASQAVFQRKHVAPADRQPQWVRLRAAERDRLLRHMIEGGLEPRDVRHLLRRLDLGYADGEIRPLSASRLAAHPVSPFVPFPAIHRTPKTLLSRPLHARRLLADAADRVNNAQIVTLIELSPSAMYHKVSFNADGVWVQRGGIYGKSDRTDPPFRLTARKRRFLRELSRVAGCRGL